MILDCKGDLKMSFTDIVILLGEGIYFLFLGSFVVGMILGILVPISMLVFPKTTLNVLEQLLRYNIECNEFMLQHLKNE